MNKTETALMVVLVLWLIVGLAASLQVFEPGRSVTVIECDAENCKVIK